MRKRKAPDHRRRLVQALRAQVLTTEVIGEMIDMSARHARAATSEGILERHGAQWQKEWDSRTATANTSTTAESV